MAIGCWLMLSGVKGWQGNESLGNGNVQVGKLRGKGSMPYSRLRIKAPLVFTLESERILLPKYRFAKFWVSPFLSPQLTSEVEELMSWAGTKGQKTSGRNKRPTTNPNSTQTKQTRPRGRWAVTSCASNLISLFWWLINKASGELKAAFYDRNAFLHLTRSLHPTALQMNKRLQGCGPWVSTGWTQGWILSSGWSNCMCTPPPPTTHTQSATVTTYTHAFLDESTAFLSPRLFAIFKGRYRVCVWEREGGGGAPESEPSSC